MLLSSLESQQQFSSLAEDTFLLSMTSIIKIKGDDGTSLGNYKVPPEGKPVPEVLDSIFKKHGLDGVLVEDDSTHLTKSDLVTAGHTYTFWPSINVPPLGREKGSTSEPVLAVVENMQSKLDSMIAERENMQSTLDSMSALLQESLLRTRAASTINVEDLHLLRRCLDTAPIPEEEEVPLSSLLGPVTEGGESFWDEDTYDLQLKDEYIRQFTRMTASRDVVWTDGNETKLKTRFSNVEFPVVAKNDLVASLKRFKSFFSVGAILEVEIKRKLSWRGLRQAEVEFYVRASESLFPFVQLITDMEHGGVVIYSNGGNDVRFRTLGSMKSVRNFVSGIVKSLPPGTGEDGSDGRLIIPDTFPSPSRKRLRSGSSGMSSANPQRGSSSIGRQMAIWNMAAAYNNNLGDVANLRDLDCFNVDSVH